MQLADDHRSTAAATTPMTVASAILPFRKRYMYSPMKSAMGMVAAIVKVPQELSRKAIHHRQAQARQRNDDDEENGDAGGQSRQRADLRPGDLRQRPAVAAHSRQRE